MLEFLLWQLGIALTNEEHSERPWVEGWVVVDMNYSGDDVFGSVEIILDITVTESGLSIGIGIVVWWELEDTGFLGLADALLAGGIYTGGVSIRSFLLRGDSIRVVSGEAWPLHGVGCT